MRLILPSYKLITAVLFTLFLSACSSKPREVSAQVPLVNPNQQNVEGELIPEKYWLILSNPSSLYLQHSEATVYLGEFYTSALGNRCRTMDVVKGEKKTVYIACLLKNQQNNDTQWYITKNIVENASFLKL